MQFHFRKEVVRELEDEPKKGPDAPRQFFMRGGEKDDQARLCAIPPGDRPERSKGVDDQGQGANAERWNPGITFGRTQESISLVFFHFPILGMSRSEKYFSRMGGKLQLDRCAGR